MTTYRNWRAPARLMGLALAASCLAPGLASAEPPETSISQGQWWNPDMEVENPTPNYEMILYQEIGPRLREIEKASNRVRVEVIGKSAQGRDLYLATVSAPEMGGRFGKIQSLRKLMIKDPEAAQARLSDFDEFKVPVMLNCSIHGNEQPGVDSCIRTIETLAFGHPEIPQEQIDAVLATQIILINVVQNPDGRVLGQRRNGNGFDLNRDFITQSQPETRATVRVLTEWNPMIMLDLHGFINPMLIEPTTAPHNPNYEYDLYLKWAFRQAEAMEAELLARTGLGALIPYRDWEEGWDDYPPIFAPMYAMYHGSYGHTLETPFRSEVGVDAHFWATWGALQYVAENSKEMIHDQIEIFRRGILDLDQILIPDELLSESPFNQFNELTVIDFPSAYIIPKDAPAQANPHSTQALIDFLVVNDVEVHQAKKGFSHGGVDYPKGTYVVWMNQPKRGLANTILWDGLDISFDPGLTMYDISGWDHTKLWGVSRVVAENGLSASTSEINNADGVAGSVAGSGKLFAYRSINNQAVKATNSLLASGEKIYRATAAFTDSGESFGPGSYILAGSKSDANKLANQYGLQVVSIGELPDEVVEMERQKLAVFGDEGVTFILRELGFDFDTVSTTDLNGGVLDSGAYDVFVNSSRSWGGSLNDAGRTSLTAFFAGGGDYVGIGRTGAPFAVAAGLVTLDVVIGTFRANGVIDLDLDPSDPVAGGYQADDYGFVFRPAWFDNVPAEMNVAAYVGPGDFFVSGFWPEWTTSGAAAKPIVVSGTTENASQVVLMGVDPTFRAHPRHTYRLLANAIYQGL